MGNKHSSGGVDKKANDAQSYQSYHDQIQPLDLLLFRGPDFVSNTIRWLQKKRLGIGAGRFSHVGMVIDGRVYNDHRMQPGKLYVLESTMSGNITSESVPDIDGNGVFGVQIRDLDEVVKAYDASPTTRIAVAPLKNNPLQVLDSQTELQSFRRTCTVMINSVEGRQYDANLLSLVGALCPKLRRARDRLESVLNTENWLFCSELCALMYKSLGLLPQWVDEKDVVPMDFLGYDEDHMPVIVEKPVQYVYWCDD